MYITRGHIWESSVYGCGGIWFSTEMTMMRFLPMVVFKIMHHVLVENKPLRIFSGTKRAF